jgi:hypothetical protein
MLFHKDPSQRLTSFLKTLIKDLDDSNTQLQEAFDALKATTIEPQFRPADEEQKTLQDFVDEEGFGNLRSSLREVIDEVQVRHRHFNVVNTY